MGREIVRGKKSIWIIETVSGEEGRVSPLFRTEEQLMAWLLTKGYSQKAIDVFVEKGWACTFGGSAWNINQYDPEHSHGACP